MYPALAVLQTETNKNTEVLWVGSDDGLEADLVKRAGIAYRGIPAAGLHGVNILSIPKRLYKLAKGYFAAKKIIREYQPDVMFFTGGYVGFPIALAGRKVPSVLFVPDIEPGMALNMLSKNADLAIGSTRFVIEDGKLYTGAAWDFDLSCGNGIRNCDPLHQVNGTVPCATDGWYAVQLWYRDLVQLDWFQDLFSERYHALQPVLVNLYEANELGTSQIDQLVENMPLAIEHNYQKWRVDGREYASARPPEKTYELNVEYLRTWLKDRNEWILQELDHGRGPKLLY